VRSWGPWNRPATPCTARRARTVLRLRRSEIELLEPDGTGPVADELARRGRAHLFAVGASSADVREVVSTARTAVEQAQGRCYVTVHRPEEAADVGCDLLVEERLDREGARSLCGIGWEERRVGAAALDLGEDPVRPDESHAVDHEDRELVRAVEEADARHVEAGDERLTDVRPALVIERPAHPSEIGVDGESRGGVVQLRQVRSGSGRRGCGMEKELKTVATGLGL
jgi:hypothetical protein